MDSDTDGFFAFLCGYRDCSLQIITVVFLRTKDLMYIMVKNLPRVLCLMFKKGVSSK